MYHFLCLFYKNLISIVHFRIACFLRVPVAYHFCSSIHLCNNSIQKNYKNAKDRSSQLPYHNMWTSSRFQEYLQKKGLNHVWHNIIYPSMKKILICTMRMAQDQIEPRRNSFELFGADFILGNDFKPWLIEINTSPTMYPSTPITSDLCAQVQEDTIKVVIDRKLDKNCDIGKFELLCRQVRVTLSFSSEQMKFKIFNCSNQGDFGD